jgi:hypothetical protein
MSRALAPAIGGRLEMLLPELDRKHAQPARKEQRGNRDATEPFVGGPRPMHRSFG